MLNYSHTPPCLVHLVSPAHTPPPTPVPSFSSSHWGTFSGSNCCSWYPSLNFIALLDHWVNGLPNCGHLFKSPHINTLIIFLDLSFLPLNYSKPGVFLGSPYSPQYLAQRKYSTETFPSLSEWMKETVWRPPVLTFVWRCLESYFEFVSMFLMTSKHFWHHSLLWFSSYPRGRQGEE